MNSAGVMLVRRLKYLAPSGFPNMLLQLADGMFQTLRRFDDVIVSPEIGIVEILHLVVEAFPDTKRVTTFGSLHTVTLLLAVSHHHLTDSGEGRGKQPFLPVTVETHLITDIAHMGKSGTVLNDPLSFVRIL